MTGNEEFLKEKAKLLLARERELLALRRKHKRLSLWLALAQRLPELIDPTLDLPEVCARVSERMVATLELHTVAFFRIDGAFLRTIARRGGQKPETTAELDPEVTELLAGIQGAVSKDSKDANDRSAHSLADAVGLHRFLWHRMAPSGTQPVLFVAGYDQERARFYAPFDEDDRAHFANTAHQLALLLGNNHLVRELKRDKERLEQFNAELERRVDERTAQLGAVNGSLQRALESLREKDLRMAEDIEEARMFQQKVLEGAPRTGPVDFGMVYRPLERVGGDVLDVYEVERGRFRIFVADATGHGVQAAMRTILLKTEYDRLKVAHTSPHSLLENLNRSLAILFPQGEILSTGCCLDVAVDDDGARITYANAGNPPLWHWSDGLPEQIHADAPLLGFGQPEWPDPLVFRMARGDLLVVASDGLTEQVNERGQSFEDAVKRTAMGRALSAGECVDSLLRDFDAFRGRAPTADDVTLVGLRLP